MWVNPHDKMPKVGQIVLCKVQHFHTNNIQEHELIHVDESDQDWRTADDNSELSYDWTVIAWKNTEQKETVDRAEHLEWCKKRALAYVDSGVVSQALASMTSDLGKHPDTAGHPGIMLGAMLIASGNLSTVEQARKFINDFQ